MKIFSRAVTILTVLFIFGLAVYLTVPMFWHTLEICSEYWGYSIKIEKGKG